MLSGSLFISLECWDQVLSCQDRCLMNVFVPVKELISLVYDISVSVCVSICFVPWWGYVCRDLQSPSSVVSIAPEQVTLSWPTWPVLKKENSDLFKNVYTLPDWPIYVLSTFSPPVICLACFGSRRPLVSVYLWFLRCLDMCKLFSIHEIMSYK